MSLREKTFVLRDQRALARRRISGSSSLARTASASASKPRDWVIVARVPAITSINSACTRSLSLRMTAAPLVWSQD
jgi:hypothetical protein